MDEVMTGETAHSMLREEIISGQTTRRLSSIAFKLEP
jgi:hypothetical protein